MWAWDGDGAQLEALTPSPLAEIGAFDQAHLAYDPVRGRGVLTVRTKQEGTRTWELSGTTWTLVGSDDPFPCRRMAFDSGRGRVVSYVEDAWGGALWEWRPEDAAWRRWYPFNNLDADDPAPSTGHAVALAPDGAMLFGGCHAFVWEPAFGCVGQSEQLWIWTGTWSCPLSDTWEWDGTTWSRIEPLGDPPSLAPGAEPRLGS